MNIRNMDSYLRNIWDWGILQGCFGNPKIKPTDIDGYVERRGHKLIIETKSPGVDVETGQEIALNSFVNDGHTVMIIWGEKNKPEHSRIITPFKTIEKDTDLNGVRADCMHWYAMAEDTKNSAQIDPARMARAFWRRRGRAYCDIMMAEWARLDALEKRNK